jgi:hypothetical protein
LNTPGLVATSTLPLGISAAGPSAESSWPAATVGKSGAAVQVLFMLSNTELWPVAPIQSTVPSGRSTSGPSSNDDSWVELSASATSVLPALVQVPEVGENTSDSIGLTLFSESTVSTRPSPSSVQPSSSLDWSSLPVEIGVHVRLVGSRTASSVVQQSASMKRPSASTTL